MEHAIGTLILVVETSRKEIGFGRLWDFLQGFERFGCWRKKVRSLCERTVR